MRLEKHYVTIASAAAEAKIAQIRVWELIRSGCISTECIRQKLFIEMSELQEYLSSNPAKYDKWQQDYAHAQINKLLFII